MKLLTRDKFRESVFLRDNHTCVLCDLPAADAHHIIERRLWPDGGYYIDNGASVCATHHLECEMTTVSVETLREACKIVKSLLPPHMYYDQIYDKWGNIVQPNGTRLRGELFFDESVQKILKKGGVLQLFTHYIKYPRTYHIPWSEGLHDDDRMMSETNNFIGKRVIVTEKMDGENTTMYSDHIHARSIDSNNHASRNWVKNFWSDISYEIPDDWRICGENMYAKHSIKYSELSTYFYGFSIWNQNTCLDWDETLIWFDMLGIEPVNILYDDIFDEKRIQDLWDPTKVESNEGYVLRVADEFQLKDFRFNVGKFVRKDHIKTVSHWMDGKRMVKNELKNS